MKVFSKVLKEKDFYNIAAKLGIKIKKLKWDDKYKCYNVSLATDVDGNFRRLSVDGKRYVGAVCFHGYVAFITEIFRKDPEARLYSSIKRRATGTYIVNLDNLKDTYWAVKDLNIGSMLEWCSYGDACECDADLETDIFDDMMKVIEENTK